LTRSNENKNESEDIKFKAQSDESGEIGDFIVIERA